MHRISEESPANIKKLSIRKSQICVIEDLRYFYIHLIDITS